MDPLPLTSQRSMSPVKDHGMHPFPEPYDVPIVLDAVRWLDDFDMARCLFYTIEVSAAIDDWAAWLRAHQVPFLLLGIWPVLLRPGLETPRFTAAEQIDQLFDGIEAHEGLLVETAHTWVPIRLFEADSHWDLAQQAKGSSARRGAVWRVSLELFQAALRFELGLLSSASFAEQCRALANLGDPPLVYSPQETEVFRAWSAAQIDAARQNYEEQRQDRDRRVLRWRDAKGRFRAG